MRENNRDSIRAYQADWYAKHPEYGRGGGHVVGDEHPKFIHGRSRTPEYCAWFGARRRCTDPTDKSWPLYGGRGIRMCPEWIRSFEAFLEHIGERPNARHQLDRIDNDRGYEPGNVRWASPVVQSHNRRTTKLTERQVEEILIRAERGDRTVDIAHDYGVHQSYVSHLKRRRSS